MPSRRIVEVLYAIEHVGLRVIARAICLACDPLGFQRREEAFHRSIIPDVARPAQRTGYSVVVHKPLELLARILATLIRVIQQSAGFSATAGIDLLVASSAMSAAPLPSSSALINEP